MSTKIEIGEDFPYVCETCFGGNPYVRMIKTINGVECKISKRPCTKFEWRVNGVKRETCVSYVVAAQKNICQVCMTDLTFGLPVGVRDAFLRSAIEKGMKDVHESFGSLPQSRVGQDYMLNQQLALAGTEPKAPDSSLAIASLINGALAHSEQTSSTFSTQLPEICADWLKNKCNKGTSCPKRPCCGAFKFPELSIRLSSNLEKQLKDKGVNNIELDGETRSCLEKSLADNGKGETDNFSDKKTTLYVSNLADGTTENILRETFSKFPGLIRVNLVTADLRPVAFIQFSKQSEAEFVLSLSGIMIANSPVRIGWAKKETKKRIESKEHGKNKKQFKQQEEEEEVVVMNNNDAIENKSSQKSTAGIPQAVLDALNLRRKKGLA